jgi:hypothetical protein
MEIVPLDIVILLQEKCGTSYFGLEAVQKHLKPDLLTGRIDSPQIWNRMANVKILLKLQIRADEAS